ncbi:hypothetical protein psyc5s11_05400 [Clostridium gelidum]|uniref:Uncharacterized protein n=1 Tax=Clostridium gelidum TaxID=704125 RepID=A0ABM7T0R9_9CLOT|nr:hypothetical protein [Clostridium gelidum]BCZ44473.1 hypothetical protein psyc5s11_05400 [Clostridium gelidum]
MKKFTSVLLISLFLSFNMLIVTSVAETKVLKEGFYKATELNFSPDRVYAIQNISQNNAIFMLIFDGNQNLQQSIRLKPQSQKFSLIPIGPNYRLVIAGNGEVSIS